LTQVIPAGRKRVYEGMGLTYSYAMRPSTMRVKMRLFGPLRERAAAAEGWRELRVGDSVADLLASLHGDGSLPEKLLRASAVAVNQEYAQTTRVLHDGDEVAILPPVSGGCA
jgi:molybdopterin converting factor small subunit